MRNEDVQVVRADAGRVQRLLRDLRHLKNSQRKTAWPSCVMAGNFSGEPARYSSQEMVCLIVSDLSPSEPQTVGPILGSLEGPTITAPAPSPKRKAVARSLRSVRSLSRSTPMTRTYSAEPSVTMPLARVRP
ncbi:hypothetical protein SALBM135S_08357 [Streptomyces alboniger]